ncbi:MAG: thioesterase family protein [Peptococcaceae bacterium]|nr:thioesterase family protein [Peptococcaceae bacterium]
MTYQHKVQYYETDRMGITHHSNYIRFMEEARGEWMASMGMSYDTFEALGLSSPVLSVQCEYKHPTTYNDIIDIDIYLLKLSRLKLHVGYKMTCRGTLVCTGESSHCFLDSGGRPVSLQRSYPDVYAAYERYQSAQGEF